MTPHTTMILMGSTMPNVARRTRGRDQRRLIFSSTSAPDRGVQGRNQMITERLTNAATRNALGLRESAPRRGKSFCKALAYNQTTPKAVHQFRGRLGTGLARTTHNDNATRGHVSTSSKTRPLATSNPKQDAM
jgi:hypothetical protein